MSVSASVWASASAADGQKLTHSKQLRAGVRRVMYAWTHLPAVGRLGC